MTKNNHDAELNVLASTVDYLTALVYLISIVFGGYDVW